jgi:hypothetical protein
LQSEHYISRTSIFQKSKRRGKTYDEKTRTRRGQDIGQEDRDEKRTGHRIRRQGQEEDRT